MTSSRRCATVALWLIVPLAGMSPTARGEVKLPSLFSDHMVLQRGKPVPVWGWAAPGEEVRVAIGGQSKAATAGIDGAWQVRLDPLEAGGPLTLEARGEANVATAEDVLVGEVWLGSGQSNMAMTVNRADDYEGEQASANWPEVRLFRESSGAATEPRREPEGRWVACAPGTVGTFSATAYFFGRDLHRELEVPVGLIVSAVGGTPIESWIRPEVQRASPALEAFFEATEASAAGFDEAKVKAQYDRQLERWREEAAKAKAANRPAPKKPNDPIAARTRKGDVGGLFLGKIAPLIPYAIRGVLWYQGEANTNPPKGPFYRDQLVLLVRDWRALWGDDDLPFAWVQLPNFKAPGRDWSLVREAMLRALELPHTGMAVTIDIGDPDNIHPTNKQAVGKRLALWALATVYGREVASSGPLPAGWTIRDGRVTVRFQHADGGLVAKGGAPLRGFEIKGTGGDWAPARATIEGETVVVSSPGVTEPIAVRYAWADVPDANLFNGAELPASPFRTDE